MNGLNGLDFVVLGLLGFRMTFPDGVGRTNLFVLPHANSLEVVLALPDVRLGAGGDLGAALLPDKFAVRHGVFLALLVRDKRASLGLLLVAFLGLRHVAMGFGLDFANVVVLGMAFLFPDIVENGLAVLGIRMNGMYGNLGVEAFTFTAVTFDRGLEFRLRGLDFLLLHQLGVTLVGSDRSGDETGQEDWSKLHVRGDVRCPRRGDQLLADVDFWPVFIPREVLRFSLCWILENFDEFSAENRLS